VNRSGLREILEAIFSGQGTAILIPKDIGFFACLILILSFAANSFDCGSY